MLDLVVIVIAVAVFFDFVNGFHDSANAISTVVATRVLKPWQAVSVAGAANFVGPFVMGVAVAKAVQDILRFDAAKGATPASAMVADPALGLTVILAALVGAIAWNLLTWKWGIPSSSSHALVGGLIGSGVAALGVAAVRWPSLHNLRLFGQDAMVCVAVGLLLAFLFALAVKDVKRSGALFAGGYLGFSAAAVWAVLKGPAPAWLPHADLGALGKTVLFMVVSPFLGFVAAFLTSLLVMAIFQKAHYGRVNRGFGRMQILSSAFYSVTHGSNDGQKTMGIIALAMTLAYNPFPGGDFYSWGNDTGIPIAVVLLAAIAMGLGTMFGGWRIVKTMATKITDLQPHQGFAAETGGGVALYFMGANGIPVSTTHAISGSIMGVGATRSMSAVHWGVARRIVMAWIITIPASAAVAAVCYWALAAIL
ncbi:MAG: inorganic phosphate transporter [Halobacteriales archaeon]|nr:inorganic phosphate transporter [Halobacteriales archaeon]